MSVCSANRFNYTFTWISFDLKERSELLYRVRNQKADISSALNFVYLKFFIAWYCKGEDDLPAGELNWLSIAAHQANR